MHSIKVERDSVKNARIHSPRRTRRSVASGRGRTCRRPGDIYRRLASAIGKGRMRPSTTAAPPESTGWSIWCRRCRDCPRLPSATGPKRRKKKHSLLRPAEHHQSANCAILLAFSRRLSPSRGWRCCSPECRISGGFWCFFSGVRDDRHLFR